MYYISYAHSYEGTLETLGLMREYASRRDLLEAIAPVVGVDPDAAVWWIENDDEIPGGREWWLYPSREALEADESGGVGVRVFVRARPPAPEPTRTTTETITITRRTRSFGYGVTSHVTRDGEIAEPKRQIEGLTPRKLLAGRRDEVRSVGGHPEGGEGCRYREGFWVGKHRVVLTSDYNVRDLRWDLEELVAGYQQSIALTVEVKGRGRK